MSWLAVIVSRRRALRLLDCHCAACRGHAPNDIVTLSPTLRPELVAIARLAPPDTAGAKALLNEASLMKFMEEKIATLGTSACPPYHLAIAIGEGEHHIHGPAIAARHLRIPAHLGFHEGLESKQQNKKCAFFFCSRRDVREAP